MAFVHYYREMHSRTKTGARVLLSLLCLVPLPLHAAALRPGDILAVYDDGDFGIGLVDGATLQASEISGPTIGNGPALAASGIAISDQGVIYTAGGFQSSSQVVRIDPATGNRIPIYHAGQPDLGSGPSITSPIGIVVEPGGGILVAGEESVVHIDPTTLDRTIVASASHGLGPWSSDSHTGMALDSQGNIILASLIDTVIYRIDRSTGDREIVTSNSVGTGPDLGLLTGLVVQADGTVVVANFGRGELLRIDPTTGNRSILSGGGIGTGDPIDDPFGMAIDLQGKIIFKDRYGLYRVDPLTGDRTPLLQHRLVTGSTGIAIVPVAVPEPSTLALVGIGGLALLATGIPRRHSHT